MQFVFTCTDTAGCCQGYSNVFITGMSSIADDALEQCTNLEYVTIDASVITIGNYAFYRCSNIKQVITMQGTTTIGRYAFYSCTSLRSLTLADSVTFIDYGAFYQAPLQCIFWAGPIGVSIIGNYALPTTTVCANRPTTELLRPTAAPTVFTHSPTLLPTVSQNPTLSPSVIFYH